MLKELGAHIQTDYALVVQWDGFVIDGNAWADEFWNYDYIGARWPHVAGPYRVGNGGFSLRSKKLLNALRDEMISLGVDDRGNEDNEDEAICIRHRELLESKYGIAATVVHKVDLGLRVNEAIPKDFWEKLVGEVDAGFDQRRSLRRGQAHHPVAEARPAERACLEPLRHQYQAGPVPQQKLDPIGPFAAEHEHDS